MKYSISWFDFVVVVVLLIGLFRGKKRGMSEELLGLFQWIGVVFLAGRLYAPFSQVLGGALRISPLFSNALSYILIALGVKIVFMLVKKVAGEKLTGSDVFGPLEYYLGMLAGMVRWFCMFFAAFAVFNSRLVTDAELAALVKQDKDVYGSSFFPRYGTIQRDISKGSFAGPIILTNLPFLLIEQSPYQDIMDRRDDFGRRKEREMNELMERKR